MLEDNLNSNTSFKADDDTDDLFDPVQETLKSFEQPKKLNVSSKGKALNSVAFEYVAGQLSVFYGDEKTRRMSEKDFNSKVKQALHGFEPDLTVQSQVPCVDTVIKSLLGQKIIKYDGKNKEYVILKRVEKYAEHYVP